MVDGRHMPHCAPHQTPFAGTWLPATHAQRMGCRKPTQNPPQGADQRDVNNRDAAKRSRKLLGMAILTGFTEDEDSWRGEIYDPNNGKTYRSIVRRRGLDRLEVKGCIGPFCQTQVWQRAR